MYAFFYIDNYNNGDYMISNHIEKEDTIILYLDFNFEIGNFDNNKKDNILLNILNYLKTKKIDINGKKVILVLGSTLLGTFIYVNGNLKKLDTNNSLNLSLPIETVEKNNLDSNLIEEVSIETSPNDNLNAETVIDSKTEEKILKDNKEVENKTNISVTSNNEKGEKEISKSENLTKENNSNGLPREEENIDNNTYVTVYRKNGNIEKIELEEYIVGVVAEEMPASFELEALKSQAIIARTYALDKISKGEKLTDTEETQVYIDKNQMKTKWGSDYNKYYNKIVDAVNSTKGLVVTYNGKYIEALYHSVSNGKTESAKEVWGKNIPYLQSVDSSWDKNTKHYLKIVNKDFEIVTNILGIDVTKSTEINIISRDESGRVSEIKVGEQIYSGIEIRTLLGLRSTDFDITITDNGLEIITRGYGHGVGLSQYGANEMAKLGYNYKDIISHYYTNIKITSF